MLKITSNRCLFVFGKRLHHGLTGVFLAVTGTLLAYHDRKDWRQWL